MRPSRDEKRNTLSAVGIHLGRVRIKTQDSTVIKV
jgi:hypothetical protein